MTRRSRSDSRPARTQARPQVGGRVRIIAGVWRGRYIEVPDCKAARPTPNRVRETLFNWLQPEIEGARCLDLFAGSGALGIEALSRGAGAVTFVDSSKDVCATLRAQLARLGAVASVECVAAEQFLAETKETFDVVFADPPFSVDAAPLCETVFTVLRDRGVLYCERDASEQLPRLGRGGWQRSSRAAGVRFGLARRTPGN